jgi:hypothetical protein
MSKLEGVSLQFETCSIAKNRYSCNDQYNTGNPDALSDGDVQGKGELNGSIGSCDDIKDRKCEITKNKYQQDRQYDATVA